jgi:hypothetical protein
MRALIPYAKTRYLALEGVNANGLRLSWNNQ